ncbi:MAG: hypothetical protein JNL64_09170 [Blastocatellia bacterium]|nr:hypothetical protein [Blastocatellia bacterium]
MAAIQDGVSIFDNLFHDIRSQRESLARTGRFKKHLADSKNARDSADSRNAGFQPASYVS